MASSPWRYIISLYLTYLSNYFCSMGASLRFADGYPPHERFLWPGPMFLTQRLHFSVWLSQKTEHSEHSETEPLVHFHAEVRDWEACKCSTEARFLAMLVNILRGSTRQSIGFLLKCKDLLFN